MPNSKERSTFGNLPLPLSTFIGRENEIREIHSLLLSNREIAEAMTAGVKAVETYVTRILNKLGSDSRVQIATWAVENGLAPSVNHAGKN